MLRQAVLELFLRRLAGGRRSPAPADVARVVDPVVVAFERPPERRRRAAIRAYVPEASRVALPQGRARSRCPELDCLRGRLPNDVLATAEQRAIALNIGADRVLITSRHISEEDYVRALAGWLPESFVMGWGAFLSSGRYGICRGPPGRAWRLFFSDLS